MSVSSERRRVANTVGPNTAGRHRIPAVAAHLRTENRARVPAAGRYRSCDLHSIGGTPMSTPPTLSGLFDAGLLAAMVDGGYVRVQRHPSLPLVIHNYTERAQY